MAQPIGRGVVLRLAPPLITLVWGHAPVPALATVVGVGCGEGADAVSADHVHHAVADNADAVALGANCPLLLADALAVLALLGFRARVPALAAVVVVGCGEGANAVKADHILHATADNAGAVALCIVPPLKQAVTLAILAFSGFYTLVPAPAAVPPVHCGEGTDAVKSFSFSHVRHAITDNAGAVAWFAKPPV